MGNLKFGDKIIVLDESSIERGTLEETMTDEVEAYYVRYSPDGRGIIRRENIFPDTDAGKRDLIDVAVKRMVSLNKIVESIFGELKK
jgi:hypothetical protein